MAYGHTSSVNAWFTCKSRGSNKGEGGKNRRLGTVSELVEQQALGSYGRLCGRTLARAHARSADPAVLAGYMGKGAVMDDALASFAMGYARRTQSDYDRLVKAKRPAKKER
jgi:hypothetical protein